MGSLHWLTEPLQKVRSFYLIKSILSHVSGGKRLIVGVDYGVVFGIWFMTPFFYPLWITCKFGGETPEKNAQQYEFDNE